MVVPVYQIYQWGIHGVVRPVDTVRYMFVYLWLCTVCVKNLQNYY